MLEGDAELATLNKSRSAIAVNTESPRYLIRVQVCERHMRPARTQPDSSN